MDASPYILLTGAGFTHNIGTPLAKGLWAQIFNHSHIQQAHSVKSLMNQRYDYEDVYHDILANESYSETDREAIRCAMSDVFIDLHQIVKSFGSGGRPPAFRMNSFVKFVRNMVVDSAPVLMFTLNQDLFIEMWYSDPISLPGFTTAMRLSAKSDPSSYPMPTEADIEGTDYVNLSKLLYLKLHGSQNWLGKRGMIIGREKQDQINEEPLLKWYLELFSSSVRRDDTRMLCIGYGFRDKHINEILVEGIECGMQLHVVNPQDPQKFMENVPDAIRDGITSYHPCRLSELFPFHQHLTDGSESQQLITLYRTFLSREV